MQDDPLRNFRFDLLQKHIKFIELNLSVVILVKLFYFLLNFHSFLARNLKVLTHYSLCEFLLRYHVQVLLLLVICEADLLSELQLSHVPISILV